ncbi:MAG: hypothetical protein AAF439_12770, partial [Pseudomonadota bacterium]
MRAVLAFAVLLGMASPAIAQLSADDVLNPGPRSEAVEDAIWTNRVESEVVYLSPSAPFQPDASIDIEVPEPEKTVQEQRTESRWTSGLFFGALLVALIVVIVLFGGSLQVSFRRQQDG